MNKKALSTLGKLLIGAVILLLMYGLITSIIGLGKSVYNNNNNDDTVGNHEQALNRALNQMNYCYYDNKDATGDFVYCGETQRPLFTSSITQEELRQLAMRENIPVHNLQTGTTRCIKVGYAPQHRAIVVVNCEKDLAKEYSKYI